MRWAKMVWAVVGTVTIVTACADSTRADDKDRGEAKAKALIQSALRAEIDQPSTNRYDFIQSAQSASAKLPEVHWLSGEVQVGKEWKSYSDIIARAQTNKHLEQYREKRDQSEPTVASQWELVQFCRKHDLPTQAIAHLSAIIELDPNHEEARKQLGYVRVEETWMKSEEVAALRQQAKAMADIARAQTPRLRVLAQELEIGRIGSQEVAEELIKKADVNAIPLWESIFSTSGPSGAKAVVETLKTMNQPEATLSLARHATWSNDDAVRQLAIEELKKRDTNAFIPAMLSEMKGPWIASQQIVSDGSNRLVNRYTLVADTKEKVALKVLDDSYALWGQMPAAGAMTRESVATKTALREQQRRLDNLRQEATNASVIKALREITGETEAETPDDWWRWWDDKNEVYTSGSKPLLTTYAYRHTDVVARIPLSTGTEPGRQSSGTTTRRKECLAGGTPIVTQRGMIAIERVRIGDLVLAKHSVTGELRFQPVLRTTVREPEQLIRLTLTSDEGDAGKATEQVIRASGGHPFWVSGQGWMRARQLEAGMRLHGLKGFMVVKSSEVEEQATRTFNLVVDDFHSYFAGATPLLTHDNTVVAPVRCRIPGLVE